MYELGDEQVTVPYPGKEDGGLDTNTAKVAAKSRIQVLRTTLQRSIFSHTLIKQYSLSCRNASQSICEFVKNLQCQQNPLHPSMNTGSSPSAKFPQTQLLTPKPHQPKYQPMDTQNFQKLDSTFPLPMLPPRSAGPILRSNYSARSASPADRSNIV